MLQVSLKEEVAKAVEGEWAGFAERHPRLAAVIHGPVLIEQVTESVGDTREYREAMERAAAAGAGGEIVADVVRRLVRKFLAALV